MPKLQEADSFAVSKNLTPELLDFQEESLDQSNRSPLKVLTPRSLNIN